MAMPPSANGSHPAEGEAPAPRPTEKRAMCSCVLEAAEPTVPRGVLDTSRKTSSRAAPYSPHTSASPKHASSPKTYQPTAEVPTSAPERSSHRALRSVRESVPDACSMNQVMWLLPIEAASSTTPCCEKNSVVLDPYVSGNSLPRSWSRGPAATAALPSAQSSARHSKWLPTSPLALPCRKAKAPPEATTAVIVWPSALAAPPTSTASKKQDTDGGLFEE
mmetsp:Transcript_1093/g.2694  ORF Transcript_1093/g.2694 Transcript_1093/m.2694 type:complete len:220 (+) Transcript_1093:148-807(+)